MEGDAAILRFLERQDYPAERLAAGDAVSDFDGSAVLVTQFAEGTRLPDGAAKFAMMGELLGRLHALPSDETAGRLGGASGEDPSREGTPRQDLLAALSFLDAVDTKVATAERERFERLRDQVRSADDGHGLPQGLLRKSPPRPRSRRPDRARAGRDQLEGVRARTAPGRLRLPAVSSYRRHVEPTGDELGRLEAVMYIRALYLACFGYRRAVTNGQAFNERGSSSHPDTSAPPRPRPGPRSAGRRVRRPVISLWHSVVVAFYPLYSVGRHDH